MAGEVWIDQAQERLARLDAHLIANVDFGWGILGKLDKGGTILLEQADIGGHDWEVTALKVNMRGKALMVKSLSIQITEEASHFSLVPPAVDYRKAIQLLEKSGPGAPDAGCFIAPISARCFAPEQPETDWNIQDEEFAGIEYHVTAFPPRSRFTRRVQR